MDNLPQDAATAIVQFGVLLILTACVATWAGILYRLSRGLPVLPYTPRRPVPWDLVDLASLVVAYLVLVFLLAAVARPWADVNQPAPAVHQADPGGVAPNETAEAELAHPVIVVLRSRPSPAVLLFCFLIAAVVAPVAEEIVFRLLGQGWLESVERRWRRRIEVWRRLARGVVPVVFVSALFAAAHYRTEGPQRDVDALIFLFAVDAAAKTLAIGFALGLIWYRHGATHVDFGFVPEKFWGDVRLGLLTYLAVVPPVLAIQAVATYLLPDWLAADPIALFVFAVALGTLYYRTHRIVPAIVTHMALNTTSLIAAWLLVVE